MLPSECLEQARDLIAEPGRWTRRQTACDREGRAVDPFTSEVAVAFCASGAISHVAPVDRVLWLTAHDYFDRVATPHIARFNDEPGRTQADVVAAFDRAIALARTEGR